MAAEPVPATSDVLLDVRDLAVAYRAWDGEEVRLIDGVTFQLRRGEALGLAGESGCGKTTTALAMLGLLPTNLYRAEGTVDIASTRGIMHVHRRTERGLRDLRWNTVSIVFQGAMNSLDPVMRVSDQIGTAIRLHEPGVDQKAVDARVNELFGYVGISPARARQYPHEFSGGMRQRVMIALALACNPELIIGDEPTTALDVMMQAQILELLERLRARPRALDDPDHARPVGAGRDVRPRGDHVRRRDRRDGADRARSSASRSTRTRSACWAPSRRSAGRASWRPPSPASRPIPRRCPTAAASRRAATPPRPTASTAGSRCTR